MSQDLVAPSSGQLSSGHCALAVETVSVRFDQTQALHQVSLTVEPNTIMALIGPSGCGKSTLLRVIAGLVIPDAGLIRWDGLDLTGVPVHRRDFGLMFQDHALFSHRNVFDNVAFGLRMRDVEPREISSRVEEMLDLVGLVGFGPRSVDQLSGGEAQRVALARAIAPRPALLLLDEPLASLDRALREELNAEIIELLRGLGQTAIYVTHDQAEALERTDEVAVMMSGRVIQVDPPVELWRHPSNHDVARFLGHSVVTVDGRPHIVRADSVRVIDEGSVSPGSGLSSLGSPRGFIVEAVVEFCGFAGDRFKLTVTVADGTEVQVFHPEPIPVGTLVRIRIITT